MTAQLTPSTRDMADDLVRRATSFGSWAELVAALKTGYVPTFRADRGASQQLGELLASFGKSVNWL